MLIVILILKGMNLLRNAIGARVRRVSPQGVVFARYLTTSRGNGSLVTRLLCRVQCLASVDLDYPL